MEVFNEVMTGVHDCASAKRFLDVNIVDAIAAVSFMSHYETMQRGILDLRDIVYFASVIGFMLFGTHVVLQHKAAM